MLARRACGGCSVRTVNWPVMQAVLLFAGWAMMALLSKDATGGTALSAIRDLLGYASADNQYVIAFVLGSCSGSLLYGQQKMSSLWRAPMLLLYLAAMFGCLQAIWDGQYADGEPRPRLFIAPDQWAVIVGAAVFVLGMLEEYSGWSLARWRLLSSRG